MPFKSNFVKFQKPSKIIIFSMCFGGSGDPSWPLNPKTWGSEGHPGSKLGLLGVILAPRLGIVGQLCHLKGQLGHFRRHLAPKVGHKMPSSGFDPHRRPRAPTALITLSSRIDNLIQNANADHFPNCREGRSQKVTLLNKRPMYMFTFQPH